MGTTMSQPAKPVKGTKPATGPRKADLGNHLVISQG